MEEICMSCKLTGHHRCNMILPIEKASKEIYSDMHYERIVLAFTELIKKFGEVKTDVGKLKAKMSLKHQQLVQKVKKIRQGLDFYLNTLEALATTNIDAVCQNKIHTLSDTDDVCHTSISELQKRVACLEKEKSIGSNTCKLSELNRATKEIKKYCSVLDDLQCNSMDTDIRFKCNEKLKTASDILDSFGKVYETKAKQRHILPEIPFIYTNELNVETKTDPCVPCVQSYYTLSDGRQLIFDNENQKLKLYDTNNLFLTEFVLPVPSFDLVLHSDTKAIVSTTNYHKLLYISIGDKLALSKSKDTDLDIGPMIKYGKDIIVLRKNGQRLSLSFVDCHGRKQMSFFKDDWTLFKRPFKLALDTDLETVYVLDTYTGIYGVTLEGSIVFQFKDSQMEVHSGLAIGKDSFYIGVRQKRSHATTVRKLNLTGEVVKDIYSGMAYPLTMKGQDLILVALDNNSKYCRRLCFYWVQR